MSDNKFIKKWERDRKKGKLIYMLLSCLIMGLSILIGAVICYLISGKISFYTTVGLVIGGVIGGAVGGILWWNSNEEKYKKLTGGDSNK